MKLSILAGATSQSVTVFIQSTAVTTGAGLTGLVFNTASLTCYRTFAGANATATAITLATLAAVNSAYSSGGFKEIDATNMPGHYRFDIPDTSLAAAKGRSVSFHFQGAANMAPLPMEIELTAWDNQVADSARTIGTVTALTNAPSDSSGITTLLARVTAARAGYFDNLSAGAVALNADMATLLTRISALRAGYFDNLSAGAVALASSLPANFSAQVISAAGIASADTKKINGTTIVGDGSGTPFGV